MGNLTKVLQERENALRVLKTWSGDDKFTRACTESESLPILISTYRGWADDNVTKHFLEMLLFSQSNLKVKIDEDLCTLVVGHASEMVCSESVGLSDTAGKLVEEIVLSSERDAGALLDEFVKTCTALASEAGVSGSILKMRYCGVMSHILGSKGRDDLFNASLEHGAVREIVDLCQSKADPLLQMNALVLLVAFAQTAAGYKYLLDNGVLTWLLDVSQPDDSGSTDYMLVGPVALDTLAAIFNRAMACGVLSHDAFDSGRTDGRLMNLFVQTMTANVYSSQEQSRVAGFNALVQFGTSSPTAAKAIESSDEVVDALVGMLRSTKAEVKVAALCGFAELVRYEGKAAEDAFAFTSTENAGGMETTSAQLFAKIARAASGNQDSLGFLLHVLRQPFSETRIAAMACMGAAAKWKWSIPLFFHSVKAATFRDFLERHTEHDKRGKEAKFGIICALTANPGFEMLSEDNQKFLKAAKGRGAFYVVPEMAEPQTI